MEGGEARLRLMEERSVGALIHLEGRVCEGVRTEGI